MIDIRSTDRSKGKPENIFQIDFVAIMRWPARRFARFALGLLKALALVSTTVGRAFEMAYVDPFSGSGSDRTQDRR